MASKHFVVLLILASTYALPESINIGGLFHSTDDQEELVFQYAAEAISTNYSMLRRRLMPLPERVAPHDSLGVTRTVCALLEQGVAGIFGPMGGSTSPHVQSICDVMDIPHIETTWDTHHKRHDVLVNLHPHPSALGKAYVELVTAWGWKSFTVIYEDRAGLLRVNPLLKMSVKGTITVKQLDTSGHQNHRPILRQIKNSGEKNIILDCTIDSLPEVLKQAQQVGLMTSEFEFIVTCLDMHTIDLEPYQYGGSNITGLRLVNPDDLIVQLTVRRWSDLEMRRGKIISITPETLTVKMALMHDAVNLFALALQHLNMTGAEVTQLDCNAQNTWGHGTSIINFMKAGFIQNTQRGLTGDIEFDNEGYRTNINLDVMELTEKGLDQVGIWNTLNGLNMTRVFSTAIQDGDESLQNRTFIVLTALSHPYGMRRKSSIPLKGNARFEGFGIELIHELSLMLGFNYTFELQHDNAYGSYNKDTCEWNGMIRQLLDNKADLAITDLTITSERESAADFTMPFMTLGISILYKRPTKAPPKLFSFMSPFSMDVWMCMFSVYLGVSIMLWIMGRICPYEWTNPYPCIQEPEELENQFTLKNSLWFTIGSLMQQGSEIAPIAVSTRMVAGIWWFFTLIIVSSYTANLAAFLTVESMTSPFKNVKELANQDTIQYGAKRGGSTVNFFRDSTDPMYQRMYQYMMDHQDEVLASTNEQGLEWVKSRNYAFFMESTSIEYITERHCEVAQIGDKLDSKGYGIAMRKNSTYRNALSTAVLKLQESGKLAKMKNRWWKEERGGGKCADSSGSGNPSPLSLANVGGVFVVLVCGSVMACFFAVFELLVNVFETSRREKVSFKEELMSELRFIARCHGTTKPVHKYHQDEGSESHTVGEEGNFVGIYGSTPYPFNGNNIKEPLT